MKNEIRFLKHSVTDGINKSRRPNRIRKQCKYGMFTVFYEHDDDLHVVVNGILYRWSQDGCAADNVITHSGNFLDGNETRTVGSIDGGWMSYPRFNGGGISGGETLKHRQSGYPGIDEVIDALDGFAPGEYWPLDGWETTNPEGGKNDQWIPWPLKIKKERVFVS